MQNNPRSSSVDTSTIIYSYFSARKQRSCSKVAFLRPKVVRTATKDIHNFPPDDFMSWIPLHDSNTWCPHFIDLVWVWSQRRINRCMQQGGILTQTLSAEARIVFWEVLVTLRNPQIIFHESVIAILGRAVKQSITVKKYLMKSDLWILLIMFAQ